MKFIPILTILNQIVIKHQNFNETLKCGGKVVKLLVKNSWIQDDDLLVIDNKSISIKDFKFETDIYRGFKCKKIDEKEHLIIPASLGNSWEGDISLNLDTLKNRVLDIETRVKIGTTETMYMTIKNITYKVSISYFLEDKRFQKRFQALLKDDYGIFETNMRRSGVEDIGYYYVGSGHAIPGGLDIGSEEAIFTINKATGDISVAILTEEDGQSIIKYFGNITPPIFEWAKKFQY